MANSVKDSELKKFIDNDTQKPKVRVHESGGFDLGTYDTLEVSRTALTDIFTYKLLGATVSVLTLTYLASNKKDLSSVVKT